MKDWFKKNKTGLVTTLLLFVGFLVRVYFVDKVVVGDLMNYAEWGEKFVTQGPYNLYFSKGWYYSTPVYPPVSIISFAGAYWLNEHKYFIAVLHNLIKFPPSVFIVYFYEWGYIFLLKLLPILCDLGISLVIYKLIFNFTKNKTKSFIGMSLFLFNPITIFISGVWGQTDSVVGLLGLLSFLLLVRKKPEWSIPLMFLGLYYKPSWAIFGLFYLFLIFKLKVSMKKVIVGIVLALLLFLVTTQPFSEGNVFTYGLKLFRERYPLPIGIDGKASISAFNFQTIFFKLDIDYSHEKLLAVTSGNWGLFGFILSNLYAMISFSKIKDKTLGVISGLFIIGFGSFLFMATMLERYFFPAYAPLFIILAVRPKLFFEAFAINMILAMNIVYSFYRRGSDEIAHLFIDNNFLVIKILSVIQVFSYFRIGKDLVKSRD